MQPNGTTVSDCGKHPLPIEWHDCSWQPSIEFRGLAPRPAPRPRVAVDRTKPLPITPFLAHPTRRKNLFKLMKKNSSGQRRFDPGFTLVELLTVIAIIAILAALLLPVLSHVKLEALKTQARVQVNDIATAIQAYDSAYGRFPVSPGAQAMAGQNGGGDITYSGFYTNAAGTVWPAITPAPPTECDPSNSEVYAILMDFTNYPDPQYGGATVNANHQKNPQKTLFLNAKMSGWGPKSPGLPEPGVGTDLVYRDPWGNPYIITMDLNYDGQCQDAFYALQKVSENPPGSYVQTGFNGLNNPNTTASDDFLYHGSVMVWSMGPNGPGTPSPSSFDPNQPANAAVNKNHILSWQ